VLCLIYQMIYRQIDHFLEERNRAVQDVRIAHWNLESGRIGRSRDSVLDCGSPLLLSVGAGTGQSARDCQSALLQVANLRYGRLPIGATNWRRFMENSRTLSSLQLCRQHFQARA
jgi:hypothetical protein